MSGIRVCNLPDNLQDAHNLLIQHFSSPDNGGGAIQEFHHPLFHGDAVVVFRDQNVVDTVMSCEHCICGIKVKVERLPQVQIYKTLEAKLDDMVSQLIIATPTVWNYINKTGGLEVSKDPKNKKNPTITLSGNWYQLEWAWEYIDRVAFHQQVAHNTHSVIRGSSAEENQRLQRSVSDPTQGAQKSALGTDVDEASKQNSQTMKQTITSPEAPNIRPPQMAVGDVSPEDEARNTMSKKADDTKGGSPKVATAADEPSKAVTPDVRPLPPKPNPAKRMDVLSFEFSHRGMDIHIYAGDVTKVETECIVNAAIGALVNGAGVAAAIAKAADRKLQTECDAYVKRNGKLKNAEVMHTCAGGKMSKKVKCVLHTVGPVWDKVNPDPEWSGYELTKTYLNSFKYASDKMKLKSMAVPLISSGIFGVPLEICVHSFINGILLFLGEYDDPPTLKEIHLVNSGEEHTQMSIIILHQLLDMGMEQLTARALEDFSKGAERAAAQMKKDDGSNAKKKPTGKDQKKK